jgi:hypothetical protein
MKHTKHKFNSFVLLVLLYVRRWLRLSPRPDKAQLIDALEAERARLEALIDGLDEAQMTTPGAQADGSLKDLLAHIAVWDERGLGWIKAAAQGYMPDMPAAGYTWDDMDVLNRQTFLENKDRPLAEVLSRFRGAYRQLLEQARLLSERETDLPLVAELIAWRCGHYRTHGQQIRAWLEQSSKTQA